MKIGGSMFESARFPTFREILESAIVRQRIVEYLGGNTLEEATCLFLGRIDPLNPTSFERHPTANLHALLDDSSELTRSLEDRDAMIVHLDIEYVNFDDPSAILLDPHRAFELQEPLVRIIEGRLLAFGIHYLHVITGQGHHFVWKIRRNSSIARDISELGICMPAGANPLFPHVALLMEHLAHLLKAEAAPLCEVPVEITAQHVGPGPSGVREMLSIDISEYGDPLGSRMIRIPYTVYRKPWISGLMDRFGITDRVPGFFTLPLHEMDVFKLIENRHDPELIIDLAHRAGAEITLSESGTRHLLESYQSSGLIHFHRKFHSSPASVPADATAALASLPPCARHILTFPNDLLLKPSGIQLITRCLLALGWHPRQISGLVTSKFQEPQHDWGTQWNDYQPAMRAEFYVRLFAGEIDQGLERGVDFNCFSQQEKQFCWDADRCSLAPFHARLYQKSNPPPS